jgi:hypothetical protein
MPESDADRAARITETGLMQRASAAEIEVARIGQETRNALLAEALRRLRPQEGEEP